MSNVPMPCTNCLRFHYGICREAPKQCFHCGVFNHIERYCPRSRRVHIDRGRSLPGTRAWCEIFALDDDQAQGSEHIEVLPNAGKTCYEDPDVIQRCLIVYSTWTNPIQHPETIDRYLRCSEADSPKSCTSCAPPCRIFQFHSTIH